MKRITLFVVFVLAFAGGVLYLVQERQLKRRTAGRFYRLLPSLDMLDRINYRSLTTGFPLLTLGIITGAIWAENAWGSYWSWDPKETWSLITWFIYAAFLHARLTRDGRSRPSRCRTGCAGAGGGCTRGRGRQGTRGGRGSP